MRQLPETRRRQVCAGDTISRPGDGQRMTVQAIEHADGLRIVRWSVSTATPHVHNHVEDEAA